MDALRIRRVSQSLWLRERMVKNVTDEHLHNMFPPLFKGEWGGGSRGDQTCHLSYLAFPAGITFFLASSLYPFFYIEISYIVP